MQASQSQTSASPVPAASASTRRDPVLARWLALAIVPALALWLAPSAVRADEKPAGNHAAKANADGAKGDAIDNDPAQWLRFIEDGKGGGKLEVATGTYKNDNGVTVHLVGAVHIGDRGYYQGLSKEFEKYDALLYELVKPADAGVPAPGAAPRGMIAMFQRFLQGALELDFQLDGIDYTKPNFVHADMDAETFARMQEEKGESLLGLMLSQMVRDLAREMEGKGSKAPQIDAMALVEAFNSPDRARQFKLILARGFGDLEEQMAGMQGTVILTERNKKAVSVLREQIRAGKKNIGVFYGAAHMSDLESRLALMGFKRTGMEWRTAWDMTTGGGKDKAH